VQFVHANGSVDTKTVNPSGAAGTVQTVNLEPHTKAVRVRGVDNARNLGGWVSVRR